MSLGELNSEMNDMVVGRVYNWVNEGERLVYLGRSKDDRYHQFALEETPDVVRHNVIFYAIDMLEVTHGPIAANGPLTALPESVKNMLCGELVYECELDDASGTMSFFCPTCFCHHTHGVDVSEDGPYEATHRSAHCRPKSNNYNGYYVFHTG